VQYVSADLDLCKTTFNRIQHGEYRG